MHCNGGGTLSGNIIEIQNFRDTLGIAKITSHLGFYTGSFYALQSSKCTLSAAQYHTQCTKLWQQTSNKNEPESVDNLLSLQLSLH